MAFLPVKVSPGTVCPDSVRADGVKGRYFNEAGWRTLDVLLTVAEEQNVSPIAVALAWLLQQPAVTAPIIGANSVEQLAASLAVTDLTLSGDQLDRLSDASAWSQGIRCMESRQIRFPEPVIPSARNA